jgi:hypothetical protein
MITEPSPDEIELPLSEMSEMRDRVMELLLSKDTYSQIPSNSSEFSHVDSEVANCENTPNLGKNEAVESKPELRSSATSVAKHITNTYGFTKPTIVIENNVAMLIYDDTLQPQFNLGLWVANSVTHIAPIDLNGHLMPAIEYSPLIMEMMDMLLYNRNLGLNLLTSQQVNELWELSLPIAIPSDRVTI